MKQTSFASVRRALIVTTLLIINSACGGAPGTASDASDSSVAETGTTDASENENTQAFPLALSITSPFATTSSAGTNLTRALANSSVSDTPQSQAFKISLDDILKSTDTSGCGFAADLFLQKENNATCFGPSVTYKNHPDAGNGTSSGMLPSGDLGLWLDNEPDTGESCASAELGARMNGISHRSHAAMMSIASMLCAMNASGSTLPFNDTLDLTQAMNDLGLADLQFETATLTHTENGQENSSIGEDQYNYALKFIYTVGGIKPIPIVVEMEHHAEVTEKNFKGRLSYLVNTTDHRGNCPNPEVTQNSSIVYQSTDSEIEIEVRAAEFCGHDSDGRMDGIVNAADRYDAMSNPRGWGNNFSIFLTQHNTRDLSGNYAYSWQAGPQDSHSRIFNIVLAKTIDTDANLAADEGEEEDDDGAEEGENDGGEDHGDSEDGDGETDDDDHDDGEDDTESEDADDDDDADTGPDLSILYSEAFFGYGDTIQNTDGSIKEFICNWFGPGHRHTGIERAQYQAISFDLDKNLFVVDSSNITYAPVNPHGNNHSCDYDGTGSFVYDTNADGSLADEESGKSITTDLLEGKDTNQDGLFTIEERIGQSGFVLPMKLSPVASPTSP